VASKCELSAAVIKLVLEEFLNKYYAIINFAVVFLPAIFGLVFYKKHKNSIVKYFIWFCVYIAIVEIIGSYRTMFDKIPSLNFISAYLDGTFLENSKWWYLIFWTLINVLFYAFYFGRIINNQILKKVIKYLAIFYFVFFVVFFVKGFDEITTSGQIPINIAQAIVIVIIVFAYFFEILKSDKILSVFNSVHFYIAAVILLWHLVMTPLIFYELYFNKSDMDYAIMKAVIFLSCNTLMYLTFSFALIWCKHQNS